MANEAQVARIRQGATAWNAWRKQHGDVAPELSGGALRGLDLSGAELSGADLSGADLRGTVLSGATLIGANLAGANLFKATLDGADLSDATLIGAQFLNCAQLMTAHNWRSAARDDDLACGAPIPPS